MGSRAMWDAYMQVAGGRVSAQRVGGVEPETMREREKERDRETERGGTRAACVHNSLSRRNRRHAGTRTCPLMENATACVSMSMSMTTRVGATEHGAAFSCSFDERNESGTRLDGSKLRPR